MASSDRGTTKGEIKRRRNGRLVRHQYYQTLILMLPTKTKSSMVSGSFSEEGRTMTIWRMTWKTTCWRIRITVIGAGKEVTNGENNNTMRLNNF